MKRNKARARLPHRDGSVRSRAYRARLIGLPLLAVSLLALALATAPTRLTAGPAPRLHSVPANTLAPQVRAPEPGASLIVSLITMGQGDLIWEKFGHNALRIRDTLANVDVIYNWGLFGFSQEGFLPRLIKGEMLYWMGADRTALFVDWYQREDRNIYEQILNLSNEQKAEVFALARENDSDANRFYNYNYYLDNCSTRIRDLLDKVLDGQIRAATDSILTGSTYRAHTRRLLYDSNLSYFGVQLVLGHPADRPISRWDEMFLPLRMMRYLVDVSVRGADGKLVPLVAEQIEVQRSTGRVPELEEVKPKTVGYLVAGLLIGGLILALALVGARAVPARFVPFGIVSLMWCVFAGLSGTFALAMWLFTKHSFMYWNENVFLLNPAHLALAFLLPGLSRGARRSRVVLALVAALSVMTILATLSHFIPGLGQRNEEMVVLALAPNLALFGGVMVLLRSRLATPQAETGTKRS